MPKIFIIDDDPTMVYLLKTLLEMDGFEVAETKDWKAILESIRIEQPDLVLMDYFLPNSDGLEILAQIRAEHDLAGKQVVMSSGMDVSEQCLAAGADAFLLKPYTPEQLLEIIQERIGAGDVGQSTSSSREEQ